ncbi:flagellar protein FliT [Caldalkalibacillus uzonensis]|uniref:Flagellar protein FliT n=1 Tax=Caldalkalibacillus uzonensis TaxID=353224 RepID=A0ABU0CVL1_9BACI|nr:hypothetical protein [Caldalkalibacillus uzonensis]MDQ0339919.1 flagellar protein FliT [Caldalkalibacillus uzonensis]
MKRRTELLKQLYDQTCRIREQLQQISGDMNDNDPATMEHLLSCIEERGKIIADCQKLITEETPSWTNEERELLTQLQHWEPELTSRMQELYQAFGLQMKKLQQGKQASHKYQQPYTALYSDGTYIDKRK